MDKRNPPPSKKYNKIKLILFLISFFLIEKRRINRQFDELIVPRENGWFLPRSINKESDQRRRR